MVTLDPEATPSSGGFLSDAPGGVDRFGRSHFARALARALLLPPDSDGLVIGIEGTWGSGKTFVINQVKTILLESADSPILVDFNPWVISGSDAVVEALLEQISAAIGEEDRPERSRAAVEAGSSVLRYLSLVRHLKYLKYVPGVTALGSAAEDLAGLAERLGDSAKEGSEDLDKLAKEFSKHNLRRRRDAAEKALQDLRRPIVVILDDLDRLPAEEIRSVLQAVKAVANFPRTAYLLSYDPAVVGRALDRRVAVGLSYLEKIVQVQYPLPESLPWRMRAFVCGQLEGTLAQTGCSLDVSEKERWNEAVSYVARLCRQPRDIIRICNRLRVSLPATAGEVDVCDVILFETLGICEPDVAAAIREWPEDFAGECPVGFENLGHHYYYAAAATRDESGEESSREERWRKRIRKPMSLILEGALRHLFPDAQDEHTSLRIRKWDRLYRLLALGPAEYLTEIGDLKQLVADLSALQNALSTDDASASSILRAIDEYRTQLHLADGDQFVECLATAASARLQRGPNDWRRLADQYAATIEQTVRVEPGNAERLLSRVMDVAPLSVSVPIITAAASDLGEWDDPTKVSEEKRLVRDLPAYKELLTKWIDHIEKLACTDEFLLEPSVYAILYRWGQLGSDYTPVRDVTKRIVRHKGQLEPLIQTCLDTRFGFSYGQLDVIWDRDELIELIQGYTELKERHADALSLLRREDVRDYFERRTSNPTLKWPPDGQRENGVPG